MDITLTWRELLVAVFLATLVYLLEYAVFSRRRSRKTVDRDAAHVAELHALKDELSALKHRFDELEARIGATGAQEAGAAPTIYDYALQYAKDGMPAQEIAGRCGISVSEATLIVAMHQEKN